MATSAAASKLVRKPLTNTKLSELLLTTLGNTWSASPHPRLKEYSETIKRTFMFKQFPDAMAFMTRAAFIMEQEDHHPTWTNTYNVVHVSFNTHDADGTVTQKDVDLAKKLNDVYVMQWQQQQQQVEQ